MLNYTRAIKENLSKKCDDMREIGLQMIDHNVSSFWWKALVKYFAQVGDKLEIRCWKEELAEIQQAASYGDPAEENDEVSIKGIVSEGLISELLSENPTDKSIYNKMTKYFTVNVERGQRRFCSAHYGTEVYLIGASDDDAAFFRDVMKEFTEEDFSVHIDE